MENVTVVIPIKKLQETVEKNLDSIIGSSYSNPFRTAIEECIKDQKGPIKVFVDNLIKSTMEDPTFKEKIGKAVLEKLVNSALDR